MTHRSKKLVLGTAAAALLLTVGCAQRKEEVTLENTPPELIYQQAEAS